jgi:hypothetical protein
MNLQNHLKKKINCLRKAETFKEFLIYHDASFNCIFHQFYEYPGC